MCVMRRHIYTSIGLHYTPNHFKIKFDSVYFFFFKLIRLFVLIKDMNILAFKSVKCIKITYNHSIAIAF